MSSKKGEKKKRAHILQPEEGSTEFTMFSLMTELHARGIEDGAYRWCLQEKADPKKTVIVNFIPADMPDGVICSVVARALNRGLVRIVDFIKSDAMAYQSVLIEAEGEIGENSCPTLISCDDCPLGYWIMAAPVEDKEVKSTDPIEELNANKPLPASNSLPTRDAPSAKSMSAAKDATPTAKVAPPAKGTSAAKDATPTAKDALPAKSTSAAKDATPTAKDALPAKGTSAAKDATTTAKDALPAKGRSAAKDATPTAKDALPAKGTSAAKDATPTAKDALPAKGRSAAKDATPTAKDALPAKGTSAAKDATPTAKDTPAAKHSPPANGTSVAKDTPPAKRTPAAKDVPSTAKDSTPAQGTSAVKDVPYANCTPAVKDATPSKITLTAKDTPPPKGTPAVKDAHLAKSTPAAKDAISTPAANNAISPKGPPAGNNTPAVRPPKGTTATKDSPQGKCTPAAKDPFLANGTPSAKDPTSGKCTPATKTPPNAKGTLPIKDSSPTKGTTAAKDPPPRKGTPAPKNNPPGKSITPANVTPAAKVTSTAKGTFASKNSSSAKNAAAAKDSAFVSDDLSSKVSPATKSSGLKEDLQTAKGGLPVSVIISAEDLVKMRSQNLPAKGLPAVTKPSPEKDPAVEINSDINLLHRPINGDSVQTESSGRVLIKPNPIPNFTNPGRPMFPAMNLPEPEIKAGSDVWGGFSMERQIRREDIEKGLQFIQSTIPFHGTEDDYKRFLQKLVEDLFTEGNALHREGEVKLALGQYTEGLTVADYAASEELVLSQELLCRLLVNRSCCYFSMGLFEKSLEDSEKALSLDKENTKALYRKAKALDKLGKHQEAYGCISHRILTLVQDESVTELAQELVQKLGLKQRRAYKRPQELETFGLMTNGVSAAGSCKTSNGTGSVDDIYTDIPNSKVFPSSLGIGYQNDSLVPAACSPPVAPAANNVNDFNDCDVIGDELDSFLDLEMASKQVPQLIPVFPTGNPLLSSLGTTGLPAPSPLPPASFGLLDSRKPPVVALKPVFTPCLDALDSFDTVRETLDSLDTLGNDTKHVEPVLSKANHKQKPTVNTVNHLFAHKMDPLLTHIAAMPPLLPNPLAQTYDFKQGCQLCYVRTGPKALDFTYKEKLEHKCKKDILLARMKSSENKAWLKIRPRPMKVNFTGPYMLCKDIQSRQDCKYGDNCTFAYYQEEIDVWNEERKGALHRDQLFQLPGLVKPGSVSRLLHEQKGIFTFLCQACFDSKPQIISKRNPENPDVCTNPSNQHSFSKHKCLVHVLNSSTVRYCKIRPNHSRFQMDVCRHEVRYGCHQEDACNFAHSHVELCVWMLQRQSGVTQEEIVLESERMWKVAEPKSKPPPKPLDMKMKFVCGQCLRNGREIEADRDGKYCAAKARHSWTKDKRVLLVMSKTKKKWVPIRPLPSIRSFPQQYEICVHVQKGKKCQYIGNCTFAHNTEERDIWTFMKENKVLDLQLVFDLCNKNNALAEKPGKTTTTSGTQKEAEKQIVMPTDYADLMAGFHCYLCGKNSNSERQWQKHIQSEKHKDRVFTLEGEDSSWKYRFPAGEFKLCERYEETQNCPHENNCPFAHGREELAEWHERRKVLQYKVSKAREDKLLEPSDSDFGKFSFIMQDLAEGSEEKGTAAASP
ncbi:zinc finger CCCH domain-containing protein 7B isoform X2 [Hyla sarda]|uniref:zinc finger CCCH domain-containing protein 7B isoform X2 n=1 Tax=Hyla sarda TaxID=327740 RepID=UPI0024C43C48|nr:zinc finger CCCH domain-containing protein 7B isoform X2 [Hyla sarda]